MLLIIGSANSPRFSSVNNQGMGKVMASDIKVGKKRYAELSYMNVLFTLFVIFVHILGEPIIKLERSSIQYFCVFTPWRLLQFVTQGFVFLSAIKLFINKRERLDIPKFYLGRAKRVLVPYIIWVVVYYLYFVKIGWYNYSTRELLNYILTGDISAQFYFVILILQFYLLTPLFMWLFKRAPMPLLLIYSLFITLILGENLPSIIGIISPDTWFGYNDRVFTTYLFYFVIGAFFGMNYEKVKEYLCKYKYTVYFSAAFFALANLCLTYHASKAGVYYGFEYYLIFAYSVSVILAFFTFFANFAKKHAKLPTALSYADRSSFMLYLSHILILYIVRAELDKRGIIDVGIRLAISTAFLIIYIVLSVIIWEHAKKGWEKIAYVYKSHTRKK